MQRQEHIEIERIRKIQIEQQNIQLRRTSEISEIQTSRKHILMQLRQDVELETEQARIKWLEQEKMDGLRRKARKDENDMLQKIRETQDEADRLRMEAEAIK